MPDTYMARPRGSNGRLSGSPSARKSTTTAGPAGALTSSIAGTGPSKAQAPPSPSRAAEAQARRLRTGIAAMSSGRRR